MRATPWFAGQTGERNPIMSTQSQAEKARKAGWRVFRGRWGFSGFWPVSLAAVLGIAVTLGSGCEQPLPQPAFLFPAEAVVPGGVTGRAVQGSPLRVVDPESELPAGTSPLAGAMVRVWDKHGVLLGELVSDEEGRFALGDLPSGIVRVEVHSAANPEAPAALVEATVPAGVMVVLGREYPVSRESAIALVLAAAPGEAIVGGTLNPLPADTLIYPSFGAAGGHPMEEDGFLLNNDAWFFLVNPSPHLEYAHDVAYVVVDSFSGAMQTIPATGRPMVNHGLLWPAGDEEWLVLDADPLENPQAELTPTSELVQFPDLALIPHWNEEDAEAEVISELGGITGQEAPKAFNNTGTDGVFAIFLRTGKNIHFDVNVRRLIDRFRLLGVPPGRMAYFDLTQQSPPPYTHTGTAIDSLNREEALNDLIRPMLLHFEPEIEARLAQGLHSTLVVYIAGHADGGIRFDFGGNTGTWYLPGNAFPLLATDACRVRVIVQSCYAGVFTANLERQFRITEHDVKLFAASASSEESAAWNVWSLLIPIAGPNLIGSDFSRVFARHVTIQDGDLHHVTRIDSAGSEVLISALSNLTGNPPDPWVRPSVVPSWCAFDDNGLPGEGEGEGGLPGEGEGEGEGGLPGEGETEGEGGLPGEGEGEGGLPGEGETETDLEQAAIRLGHLLADVARVATGDPAAGEVVQEVMQFRHLDFGLRLHSSLEVPSKEPDDDVRITSAVQTWRNVLDETLENMFGDTDKSNKDEDGGLTGFTGCGDRGDLGELVCAEFQRAPTPGDWLAIAITSAAGMFFGGGEWEYQFGFAFDADGDPTFNYTPPPEWWNDYFRGTDRWYRLTRDPSTVVLGSRWKLEAFDAIGSSFSPRQTAARVIIRDGVLLLLVPLSEFDVDPPPYRVTAFKHTGDFGVEPPHAWSGDYYPEIHEALATIPAGVEVDFETLQ